MRSVYEQAVTMAGALLVGVDENETEWTTEDRQRGRDRGLLGGELVEPDGERGRRGR